MFLYDGYNWCKVERCTISDQCCKPSVHVLQPGLPNDDNQLHRIDKPCGLRVDSNNQAKTSSLLVLNNGQSR
jgi:hypothetical protein